MKRFNWSTLRAKRQATRLKKSYPRTSPIKELKKSRQRYTSTSAAVADIDKVWDKENVYYLSQILWHSAHMANKKKIYFLLNKGGGKWNVVPVYSGMADIVELAEYLFSYIIRNKNKLKVDTNINDGFYLRKKL